MANLLKHLDVTGVSLVDRAAVRDHSNPHLPQRLLLWKRADEGGDMPTIEEVTNALSKAESERDELRKQLTDQTDLKTALQKAQDEAKAARDELAKATGDDKPKPTEIDKSELPEAVRVALEKAESDRTAMQERVEKAEKLAKAEQDARLTREFIAKAETFEALPITPGDFGLVLKSVAGGVDDKTFEALETVLKAADEQIAKGELFSERGRAGDPQPKSVHAEVVAKAEEIRKSDSKLSPTAAFDKALSEDRDLQSRYLAEIR